MLVPEADPAGPQAPAFCPRCGAGLGAGSLVVEIWVGALTVHHCWCRTCGFAGDIVAASRVETHEPAR